MRGQVSSNMDTAAINNMDKVRDDFCFYIYCICISKILFIIILSSTFVCTVHSNRDKKEKMFIIFSGHAQASDPDPEVAAKHGEDARQ